MKSGMPIEGSFVKPYVVWQVDHKRERVRRIAEYDTFDEYKAKHRTRLDMIQVLYFAGKPVKAS